MARHEIDPLSTDFLWKRNQLEYQKQKLMQSIRGVLGRKEEAGKKEENKVTPQYMNTSNLANVAQESSKPHLMKQQNNAVLG